MIRTVGGTALMSMEVVRRSAFTVVALLIYWLGLHIPLPGIDAAVSTHIFDIQSGGVLGQANALSGGALRSLSMLSLSITPYSSVAIVLQMLAMVSRRLRALADDERGRLILKRITLDITVLLTLLQAYGVASGLEGLGAVVSEPGSLFVSPPR